MARWGSEPVTGTDTAREPLLRVRGLRREFPAGDRMVAVLQDVDLDIEAGEMVAIIGASGSGKSTLMNILGCLDRPSAGSYRIAGRDTMGVIVFKTAQDEKVVSAARLSETAEEDQNGAGEANGDGEAGDEGEQDATETTDLRGDEDEA